MSEQMRRAVKLAFVLVLGLFVGVAVAMAFAVLGHAILVLIYGQDLAPIDDTTPMIVAVWTCYLAGIASGLVVLRIGWRRFVRR